MTDIIEFNADQGDEIVLSFDDGDEIVINSSSIVVVSGNAATLEGHDANYFLLRENHTGSQTQSTIIGLVEALAALVSVDQFLQTGIDAEVSDRIDAIIDVLYRLESKADLVNGFIPTSQLPAVAVTELVGTVNTEAAMLALVGQRGDWCHRTDVSKAYILIADDSTQIGSWKEWPMPVSPVTSINGQVGVIVLGKGDIGLGNVPNIDATKRENHSGTQPASSITGLAAVATSGDYNDLKNKPVSTSGDAAEYTTPTALKSFTNQIISTPPAMSECLLDANFTIPANSLVAGDVYMLHAYLVARTVSQAAVSMLIVPYINDNNINGASATVALLANGNTVYEVKCFLVIGAIGVSGSISVQGLVLKQDTALTAFSTQTATYNTTSSLTLNFPIRVNAALNANSWLKLRSAKLYRLKST